MKGKGSKEICLYAFQSSLQSVRVFYVYIIQPIIPKLMSINYQGCSNNFTETHKELAIKENDQSSAGFCRSIDREIVSS